MVPVNWLLLRCLFKFDSDW